MRTQNVIGALFPSVRGELLAAFVRDPQKSWTLSEIADRLQSPRSSLQREVASLTDAGILKRTDNGRRIVYQINSSLSFLPELQGLFAKTFDVVGRVRESLEPFLANTDFAFIYGSVARNEQSADSDVDVMLIGGVRMRDLAPVLRETERALGVEISVTVYSPMEFDEKVRQNNHFLQTVLNSPKQFLKGTQDELADAYRRPKSETPSNESAGTR